MIVSATRCSMSTAGISLAVRPVHPEIGYKRVVPAEQVGETMLLPGGVEEAIVARLAAVRKLAAEGRDALDLTAKLDLFLEKLRSCFTIFGRLIGKRLATLFGKL